MAGINFQKVDDALVETFSTKIDNDSLIVPLSDTPKKEKSLAPSIPDISFDTSIPETVKTSMDNVGAVTKQNNFDARQRTESLINAIKEGQNITADAQANIAESEAHTFGFIIGLSNDAYSVPKQKRRILDAQRKVNNQVKIGQLEGVKDQLEEADAGAEYTEYLRALSLKQKNLGISTAVMNAIVQSNAAKKSLNEHIFSQASVSELKQRKQSSNFDETFTEQRINNYFRKMEKSQMDLDTSKLAFKDNQLDLGRKLEANAIERLPINYLRNQLQESQEAGESFVTLGKDFKVAPSKVRKMISEKEDIAQKFREQETKRAVKLAQNNAEFNTAQRDMDVVSRDFHGGYGQGLSKFNMLNTTDETLAEIDFNSLHPAAASEYFALQKFTANMNGKTDVTEQDIETQNALAANLQTKLDEIKKAEIDAQSDKDSKAATQEWYNNAGRMRTGKNSATLTANNITTTPDFGGDTALRGAYSILQQNMLEDLTGTTVNLFDEAGEMDTEAFFQSALSKQLKGKRSNSQVILRNINIINDAGKSPLSEYTNIKTADVLLQSVRALAEVNPNVSAVLLDENGNPTDAWRGDGGGISPVKLAVELARLANEAQKLDPSLPANAFNYALQKEVNAAIAEQAPLWGLQLNKESGSFMVNLFNNKQPAQLVETAIQNSWARHVGGAWNALQEESRKKQVPAGERYGPQAR